MGWDMASGKTMVCGANELGVNWVIFFELLGESEYRVGIFAGIPHFKFTTHPLSQCRKGCVRDSLLGIFSLKKRQVTIQAINRPLGKYFVFFRILFHGV